MDLAHSLRFDRTSTSPWLHAVASARSVGEVVTTCHRYLDSLPRLGVLLLPITCGPRYFVDAGDVSGYARVLEQEASRSPGGRRKALLAGMALFFTQASRRIAALTASMEGANQRSA